VEDPELEIITSQANCLSGMIYSIADLALGHRQDDFQASFFSECKRNI